MNTTRDIKFESPTFARRIKGMLGVDFYRLFHTPLFYIFLAIAAIIPAMVSAMTVMRQGKRVPSVVWKYLPKRA